MHRTFSVTTAGTEITRTKATREARNSTLPPGLGGISGSDHGQEYESNNGDGVQEGSFLQDLVHQPSNSLQTSYNQ